MALLAVLPLFAGVSPAAANPLLSGYGGPGQGSQMILGATLIGGPPGTGSSGPSGGGGGAAASATTSLATGSGPAPARRGGGGGGVRRRAAARPQPRGALAVGSSEPRTLPWSSYPAAASSPQDPLLGITATELIYVLLGLALLGATAALTWHSGGRGAPRAVPLKGNPRKPD